MCVLFALLKNVGNLSRSEQSYEVMKIVKLMVRAMVSLGMNTLQAEEPAAAVKVGDKAPGFSLTSEEGKTVSLADFKSQNIVLVFSRAHW